MTTPLDMRQLQQRLPAQVEVYFFDPSGSVQLVTSAGVQRLDPPSHTEGSLAFLRFIDDGQFARYLIGDAATSPQNPTNATYKLGVMQPHSAFTPHAHGAEHVVLSLGYASCCLYDWERERSADVRLPPGSMLRIPSMLPHSFNNRAGQPLLLLAANTGVGIDHADYAITAGEAERRAARPPHEHQHSHAQPEHAVDYALLAQALRRLEQTMPRGAAHAGLSWRERVAAQLRRLAWALEHR